jgi:hypothetical protein
MTTINDNYIVTFDNEEHKRYVELLQSFGFDLILSASLSVGLKFVHPIKGHIVRLDIDDDDLVDELYEPHLFIYRRPIITPANVAPDVPPMQAYDTPMYPEHYSDVEWQWLQEEKLSNFELLKRELYIWFKVRPHSMNTMKMLD